jgi:hypothetical protein
MTVGEPPCYTLINTGQDAEPPSEMQLREDLEKGNEKVRIFDLFDREGHIHVLNRTRLGQG